MDINFYEILGVSKTASVQEIKTAYRKLMRNTHPDMGGTNALFVLINEAYETLGDPVRRAGYDRERQGGAGFGSSYSEPKPDPKPRSEPKPEPTYADEGERRRAEREARLKAERLKREAEAGKLRQQESERQQKEADRVASLAEYRNDRARRLQILDYRWEIARWVAWIAAPIILFIIYGSTGYTLWWVGAIVTIPGLEVTIFIVMGLAHIIFNAGYAFNTKMGEDI